MQQTDRPPALPLAAAWAAGESLAGTARRRMAGWVFAWLGDRSRSPAAPMLAHLTLDEAAGRSPR